MRRFALLAVTACVAACAGALTSIALRSDRSSTAHAAPIADLRVIYEDANLFFEGPCWDPDTETLYFTAFGRDGARVMAWKDGEVRTVIKDSGGINGLFRSRRGGLIGCQGNKGRIVRITFAADGSPQLSVVADNFQGQRFVRPNDLVEDARGGIYFSDPSPNRPDRSAVYYITPDGQVRRVVTGLTFPNGVYLEKGGRALVVSESRGRKVYRYPVDPVSGNVAARQGRVFFSPSEGNDNPPDGMSMDQHGNYYFTGWGGVWVVSPTGELIEHIPVPEFVSNCTFGGKDGTTLFLTCRGKVYAVERPVRGWELASMHRPTGKEPVQFQVVKLDGAFRSEGVAIADVDQDGKMDVLAGEVWYRAPDWKRYEIAEPGNYIPNRGYSQCFGAFAGDFNKDGYPDLLSIPFPGAPCYWYENPRGDRTKHWRKHLVWHSATNETPLFEKLLGRGRQLVMGWQPKGEQNAGYMAYFIPRGPEADTWEEHTIDGPGVPGTFRFYHGLGVGDVNGDGRNDVLVPDGWWEQPEDPTASPWPFHKERIGYPCANMYAVDINGDGLNDVVCSSAHSYGIWWFEQKLSADGTRTWVEHLIDDTYSQTHALLYVDVDGDGTKDFVTGKRYFAHQGRDPGGFEPVVMYWYKVVREGAKVQFERHLICLGVGIGTQFAAGDINGDGKLDFAVSNKRGVHLVLQR